MVAPPTLHAWIEEHGPLGPHEAAATAVMCASRLLRERGARRRWCAADLDAAHIVREDSGLWGWRRDLATRAGPRASEHDAATRLGCLLYVMLGGAEPPAFASAPVNLRRLRPELPAGLDGIVSRALAGQASVARLAAELQGFLGVAQRRAPLPRSLAWAAATLALVITLVGAAGRVRDATARDISADLALQAVDAYWESSFGLAWMDEQTSAGIFGDSLVRLEGERFGFDSPPVWWRTAWSAWLRQQANDYLTAEQYGDAAASRLAALLGPDHPYAMSAAIVQASTLQQRRAWDAATSLIVRVWRGHARRLRLSEPDARQILAIASLVRTARLDRDRDGDGLADLAEGILGTPADRPAAPADFVAERPARGYALPLSPGFLVAHVASTETRLEGFVPRTAVTGEVTPLHPLASVQRAFAERYGWLLMVVAGPGACAVELDTGSAPRRLRVGVASESDHWRLSAAGTSRRLPSVAGDLLVAGDYDAATRTIFWWTSAGQSWTTPFDRLPPSGPAPYGVRLMTGPASAGCRSVTWTLRRAEIAPM